MTRRALGWAARLYPLAWRQRYGEEFLATVEDMPAPGWKTVWDVGRGAMAMQIRQNGRAFFRQTAIFGLAGFLLAGLISLRVPDEYLAQSLVGATDVDNESVRRSVARTFTRQSLLALVEKHGLYADERTRLPLEDIFERMKRSIRVSTLQGKDPARQAFRVGFVYDNGPVSQSVTTDLVAALLHDNQSANGRSVLTVLDAAPNPSPIYPNRPVFALTGLLGGLLLGAAWMLLRRT